MQEGKAGIKFGAGLLLRFVEEKVMRHLSNEWKGMLFAFLCNTIFGFSFMFSRIAFLAAEQWIVLAWRFGFTLVGLNLLCLFGLTKVRFKGKPWKKLLLLGICDPLLYYVCESWGIYLTNSSFSAVMIALMPIVSLSMAALILKEIPTFRQTLCAIISIAGVIIIAMVGNGLGTVNILGVLALIGAILTAAFFTVLCRQLAANFTAFERTYGVFSVASLYFIFSALVKARHDFSVLLQPLHDPMLFFSVAYLGLLGSIVAYLCYNLALNYLPVARVTVFSNWTTVMSIAVGMIFLHEPFTPIQLVGTVVILTGLYGVNRFARRDTEENPCVVAK